MIQQQYDRRIRGGLATTAADVVVVPLYYPPEIVCTWHMIRLSSWISRPPDSSIAFSLQKFTNPLHTRSTSYLQHYFFFFILFIFLALLSRSLPVVTQIRGHIAGPRLPSPLRYVRSFYRENNSAFSSLVDSRRMGPTDAARRSQQ